MILSFSTTCKLAKERKVPDPLTYGTKTVSRRFWKPRTADNWVNAWKKGNLIHQAWSTLPYVKGARQLGFFRLSCQPYQELLADMPESDIPKEGGFWRDKQHFIDEIGEGDPSKIVWVVRWDIFYPQ